MATKRLDDEAAAREDILNAPEADEALPEAAAPSAPTAVDLPREALFDDDAAGRHGRITAKSLGIGYKKVVGEALDGDIQGTISDVMGEVFSATSKSGNKAVYWGLLGLGLLPLLGVMVMGAMATWRESGKDAD